MRTLLNITLFFMLYSIFQAYTPGLQQPQWYKGKLSFPKPPELKQPFEIQFQLQSIYPKINHIKISLNLPEGITILEGKNPRNIDSVEPGEPMNISWLAKADKEIRGLSIQAEVLCDYPKKAILDEVDNYYASAEGYLRDQLKKQVKDSPEKATLYFSHNIILLTSEGFERVPPILFTDFFSPFGSSSSPFLYYNPLQNRKHPDPKIELALLQSKESKLMEVMNNPEVIAFFQSYQPAKLQQMMEEVYNSYYTLAILAFLANNYEETENWLNKLSQLILKETKINTDLFLAVRNLQALALAAQKKEAPAADLLKSTIRSAPSSLTRYYLMYNLAVLHAKNRNLTQMNHYLTEALKLNPALTVAKKLQAKYAKQ